MPYTSENLDIFLGEKNGTQWLWQSQSMKMTPHSLPSQSVPASPCPSGEALRLGKGSFSHNIRVLFRWLLLHWTLGSVSPGTGPYSSCGGDPPCVFESQMTWGLISQALVFKSWDAQYRVSTLHSSDVWSSRFVSSRPIVGCCTGWKRVCFGKTGS